MPNDKKDEIFDVSVDQDISQGTSTSLSDEKVNNGLWSRVKGKLQLEPQPGTFAPGRWSNIGKTDLYTHQVYALTHYRLGSHAA